jgi:osmotically-inducible protein OsmY
MSMRTFIVVLLLAPLTQAMAVPPTAMAFAGEKIKAPVTDDSVRDQVMLRLAGDSEVKGGGVDVSVKDGAVTLKGVVDTDKARSKAEKLAKHVKGVVSVVNQLTVRK